MNKKLTAIGLAAGLTAGGIGGLVLAVPAISNAQTTDNSTATTTAPATGTFTAPSGGQGPGGHEMGRRGPGGPGMDSVATALGMTADELHTALESGQTLAQVAASKGVDVQVVIDALTADMKAHIADEVSSGEITQAQADQKLADLGTHITDMVNNTRPAGGPGGDHGPRGPRGAQPTPSSSTQSSTSQDQQG